MRHTVFPMAADHVHAHRGDGGPDQPRHLRRAALPHQPAGQGLHRRRPRDRRGHPDPLPVRLAAAGGHLPRHRGERRVPAAAGRPVRRRLHRGPREADAARPARLDGAPRARRSEAVRDARAELLGAVPPGGFTPRDHVEELQLTPLPLPSARPARPAQAPAPAPAPAAAAGARAAPRRARTAAGRPGGAADGRPAPAPGPIRRRSRRWCSRRSGRGAHRRSGRSRPRRSWCSTRWSGWRPARTTCRCR